MENIVNKRRVIDKNEQEILEILAKSDEAKYETLFFDADGDLLSVDEKKQILAPNDTDDPVEKHTLFYKGIQKILNSELPKGKKYKEVKVLVREEINTFLSRGKTKKGGRRGADARMGYVTDMNTAYEAIIEWAANKESAADLYQRFKELNKIYQTLPEQQLK